MLFKAKHRYEMAQWLRTLDILQKVRVQFPVPTPGASQAPVAQDPGDLIASEGQTHTQIQLYTHNIKNKEIAPHGSKSATRLESLLEKK